MRLPAAGPSAVWRTEAGAVRCRRWRPRKGCAWKSPARKRRFPSGMFRWERYGSQEDSPIWNFSCAMTHSGRTCSARRMKTKTPAFTCSMCPGWHFPDMIRMCRSAAIGLRKRMTHGRISARPDIPLPGACSLCWVCLWESSAATGAAPALPPGWRRAGLRMRLWMCI